MLVVTSEFFRATIFVNCYVDNRSLLLEFHCVLNEDVQRAVRKILPDVALNSDRCNMSLMRK